MRNESLISENINLYCVLFPYIKQDVWTMWFNIVIRKILIKGSYLLKCPVSWISMLIKMFYQRLVKRHTIHLNFIIKRLRFKR